MKIIRQANGKSMLKITRQEWESYGRQAGWLDNKAPDEETVPCEVCGKETKMVGTGLCDRCWMVEGYLENPVKGSDKELQYRMAPQDVRLKAREHLKSKGKNVPHINMNDAGPGYDLSTTAQADNQLQPLDGVQTSDAAKGSSAKPKKQKCSVKGCNKVFDWDASNPKETRCESCRG